MVWNEFKLGKLFDIEILERTDDSLQLLLRWYTGQQENCEKIQISGAFVASNPTEEQMMEEMAAQLEKAFGIIRGKAHNMVSGEK